MLFISPKKFFSFSRYLNFCHGLFGHVEKMPQLERLVNFKIHDITTWLTNNCNTHIA